MTADSIKEIIKKYNISGTDKTFLENVARWHSERDRGLVRITKEHFKQLSSGVRTVYVQPEKLSLIQKIKNLWK